MDDNGGFGNLGGPGGPGGFGQMDPRDPRMAGMSGAGGMGGLGPGQLTGLAGMLGMPGMAGMMGGMQGDMRDPRGMRMGGRDSRDVRTMTGRDAQRSGTEGQGLETIELKGEGRIAGPNAVGEPTTVAIDSTGLTIEIGGARPIRAGFRDLSLIAIQQATILLVLGDGPDGLHILLDKFADKLGPMVRLLRELRLKQRLSDGLVEVPDGPAELVEFAWKPTTDPIGPGPDGPASATSGVGQLVVHGWGFVVCPLDERQGWIHYRRAAIDKVETSPGQVVITGAPGTLTLEGLGPASTRLHDALAKLRDSAFDDASGFVEQLMPDAPFGLRRKASDLLVDGRPNRPEAFDSGWSEIETAVLGEPEFADSYKSLCQTAGDAAPCWVSMSPESPGSDTSKIWFLVAMPGNLVAMELVTAGAHATYFFRVMPRAQYKGEGPDKLGVAAEQAVRDISEALVDCRFLREPMAIPDDQLRLPKYLRYRLALAVLPTLAAARGRFVARVVHKDPASWSAAVADLIKWHGTAKDEAAIWPGRAAQEKAVAAAGGDGDDEDADAATDDTEATDDQGGTTVTKPKPSGSAS